VTRRTSGVARAAAAALLAGCFATAYAQAGGQENETTFSVDVSLVNVLVTVKDAQGAPIGGLEKEDFTILDGGVLRPITVFERRTDRPLSVTLMIDASLSTAVELNEERISARRFVQNLFREGSHPSDRVAVLKFSAYVDLLADFTRSLPRVSRALRAVRPESGTSIYDAILLASEELAGREGRRVMIIITDGGDTTSTTSFERALRATHAIDGVIYGMIVMPIKSDAGRNTGGENALKALAANTGGATFVQQGTDNLDEAFDEILRNLRTQYLLGYYPPEFPETNETFRSIEIQVGRPNVSVLARKGYFLPEPRRVPVMTEGRPSIRPKAPEQQPQQEQQPEQPATPAARPARAAKKTP
jgi:Ca-activated chloride channel family protein